MIWRLAMGRQRIIKLRLRNRVLMDGLLARQGETRPKTRLRRSAHGVVVDGYQTLSKMFRRQPRVAMRSIGILPGAASLLVDQGFDEG